MQTIIHIISLAGLIAASYMDIRTREVADWLNFSLIASGIGINLILSLVFMDFNYILFSLLGLAVSVALGYLMFYTGQWGGGDSKMLMGMGALLGLQLSIQSFMLKFYTNILFAGALYGMIWVIILGARNYGELLKNIKGIINQKRVKRMRIIVFSTISVCLLVILFIPESFLDSSIKIPFYLILVSLFLMQYLWIIVKAIEKISMVKMIPVERLTEGDWVVDEVVIDGKKICGPKDLGIEKAQIKKLLKYKEKGKIKNIKIKEGIPFIPSFLIAYVYTLLFGDIILLGMLL